MGSGHNARYARNARLRRDRPGPHTYLIEGGGLAEDVRWRLSVMSLDTLVDHPLAETRNVDDQAEWRDDGTVLYGLESDTWAVPADGTGSPNLFASRADSLVVVRTP